jgi:hypothetical protein
VANSSGSRLLSSPGRGTCVAFGASVGVCARDGDASARTCIVEYISMRRLATNLMSSMI